jgi:hypothetical protein
MRKTVLTIILATLPVAPVSAQQSRDRKPDKPAAALPLRPARTAANPCAEYGPGFVRPEGSSTCMKIGGSVGIGGPR